jgi:predicted O-linked N-acetylglucosamine transferase (SPINDLY family)
LTELVELHDRSRFEVVAISVGPDDDTPYRKRLERAFDQFVTSLDWPMAEFSQRIRALDLDILVDLMGHTRANQLAFLECRPAPVQVNYLGFPGTAGADFIDYCIADRFVAPTDHENYFSEKVVRLPGCYQVNDRKRPDASHVPSRKECGLPLEGFVFCCFGNASKMTPAIYDVWMRLLRDCDGSVLWLLEQSNDAAENLRRETMARGVDPNRVIFAPKLSLAEHLARLKLADLVLDTFPYNGHTSTSDALWVGVPVVTRVGRNFAARVAGSILSTFGMTDLTSQSLEEYEALAISLAKDRERLRAMRDRIKVNRDGSPLFDTPRYCAEIESAFVTMYEIWRSGEQPRAIEVEPIAAGRKRKS